MEIPILRQITWWHRSTVNIGYLTAPSHCLDHCWLVIKGVLSHSPENNFIQDAENINPQTRLEITLLKSLLCLPGADELSLLVPPFRSRGWQDFTGWLIPQDFFNHVPYYMFWDYSHIKNYDANCDLCVYFSSVVWVIVRRSVGRWSFTTWTGLPCIRTWQVYAVSSSGKTCSWGDVNLILSYCQTSCISAPNPKLKCFSSCLAVVFAQFIETRC